MYGIDTSIITAKKKKASDDSSSCDYFFAESVEGSLAESAGLCSSCFEVVAGALLAATLAAVEVPRLGGSK